MGGQAVVKVPYSNAGQGVFTIITEHELDAFMELDFDYDRFIVQALIGNYGWSSTSSRGKLYHVGSIPTKKMSTYVFDLRMMVHATDDGIRPLGVYSRRAAKPLVGSIDSGMDSWAMLGTNLSIKKPSKVAGTAIPTVSCSWTGVTLIFWGSASSGKVNNT